MNVRVFLVIVFALTSATKAEADSLLEFFVGKYLVVGKGVDTEQTYTGKVEIYRENSHLNCLRVFDGTRIIGRVTIEPVVNGDTQVLRFRYEESGEPREQTCLWQTDLDNYPRISCYVYLPGVKTQYPGLEVLFHDHTAD